MSRSMPLILALCDAACDFRRVFYRNYVSVLYHFRYLLQLGKFMAFEQIIKQCVRQKDIVGTTAYRSD